jgi:hypothetical protein
MSITGIGEVIKIVLECKKENGRHPSDRRRNRKFNMQKALYASVDNTDIDTLD